MNTRLLMTLRVTVAAPCWKARGTRPRVGALRLVGAVELAGPARTAPALRSVSKKMKRLFDSPAVIAVGLPRDSRWPGLPSSLPPPTKGPRSRARLLKGADAVTSSKAAG